MVVLSRAIQLYAKKVVTDLGTRVGHPTKNSFCGRDGMSYVIQKYWKGTPEDRLEFDMGMFLEQCADFDADKVKPCFDDESYSVSAVETNIVTGTYDPMVDKVNYTNYYRRLEDIAEQYLERYMGNLMYSILYNANGLSQYKKTCGTQATLSDSDEEGEFVELADLLIMENVNEWSLSEKNEATLKLPYVLKRLHNLSMYSGVHMIEYIVSYTKALEENRRSQACGSTKTLKVNAVLAFGVHKYTKYGYTGDRITIESRNKKAAHMFEWLCGNSKDYASYREDFTNFLHYMEVLNINMDDDFSKYDMLFMDKLTVSTVTPNSQYDVQVFEALRGNLTNDVPIDIVDPIENSMSIFNQAIETHPLLIDRINNLQSQKYEKIHSQGESIYATYKLIMENKALSGKLHWEYGYLYHDGKPAIVTTTWVNSDSVFAESNAIISELGFIVQITKSSTIACLDVDYAYAYVLARCKNEDFDERRMEWKRITA